MKITKEETKAMLDNKVSDCGYDMNSIFHGYDILYFKGQEKDQDLMPLE